jgi:hypothetical protein
MDEIMNKVGTYWLGQRANKEISSAGDDIEVRGTEPSHPCSFLLLIVFLLKFCSVVALFCCSDDRTPTAWPALLRPLISI